MVPHNILQKYCRHLQAVSTNSYHTTPPKNKGENGSHTYIDAFFSVFVTKSFPQNAKMPKFRILGGHAASVGVGVTGFFSALQRVWISVR